MAKEKKRDISGYEESTKSENVPARTNYLFTIGIDDYVHCPQLSNAVKDARDVANVLLEKYDFHNDRYWKLENDEATKDNIIDRFREIKRKLQPKDNLVIYYSGHGELDEDFNESYWIPVTSRKNRVGDYLSLDSLIKYVRAIKTHHTLLIIDACFAGAALVTRKSSLKALEQDPSRYVIASGRKEFAADGVPGENSPFATALLEKLNNNHQSLLTTDLAQYIKLQTIKATKGTQRPIHNPLQIMEDKGGEFVFHLKEASEERFWEGIKRQDSIVAYNSYLMKFPEGQNKEEATFKIALKRDSITAYDDYLDLYPDGKYVDKAEQLMRELERR